MVKRMKWNERDAQRFADGHRERAQTFVDRRKQMMRDLCRKRGWSR